MKSGKVGHIRIAFTGGGSGGHILPIVSLMHYIDGHDECRSRVEAVYWFGEKRGMEYDFFKRYHQSFDHIHPQFVSIVAGKYRRETIRISRWRNIRDVFLFPIGIIQSLYYLLIQHIDVVFCKGGYVSLPVVIAAWLLRISLYVHDSDTKPGLTNRIASRCARQNFSGFPNTLPRSLAVGQILSDRLLDQLSSISPPNSIIHVLVAGGSLGAKKLYQGVIAACKQLGTDIVHYHFTFLNGNHLIDEDDRNSIASYSTITDLITDQSEMGCYYAQADVAIVRGGTTTLAECKIFDIPLAIVPLPVTHDQTTNANHYAREYADSVINQNSPMFVQELQQFILASSRKNKNYNTKMMLNRIQGPKKTIVDAMLMGR